MSKTRTAQRSIGVVGALSIGVGGIVGGGFFATFGITVEQAQGGTPVAFIIGGIIALLTAYSYIGLTIRYPGPGGTVGFLSKGFGQGYLSGSLGALLILSYVAIMSVYAYCVGAYAKSLMSPGTPGLIDTALPTVMILLLGLITVVGAKLLDESTAFFNIGKLAVLGLFIAAGLAIGPQDWTRLEPAQWAPAGTLVAAGMMGFLAYEGFELIANASGNIRDTRRVVPIAMLGSVLIAIVIYALAFIVAIIHMDFATASAASDYAVSEAARVFLGEFGFVIMGVGAILASASAIGADYFGASRLPPDLASMDELPSAFHRQIKGRALPSVLAIAILAVLAVNLLDIHALSSATSGGFLAVYAAVNLTAIRLRHETGTRPLVPAVALFLCLAAIAVMIFEFITTPGQEDSALAVVGIVVLAFGIEATWRLLDRQKARKTAG